jgi:hypothetical protein
MTNINKYLITVILPLGLLWSICFILKIIVCHFSSNSSDADFLCSFKWKDGFILLCSYSLVRLITPILGLNTFYQRVFATILLYSIFYGLYAFPFWIASFIQPIRLNVFLQVLLLIILVEYLFIKIINIQGNKNATKKM